MLLAPSEIHFIQDSTNGVQLTPDQRLIKDLSHKIQENRDKIPKIQVVEKDGAWFALNNSYLHVVRELERQGKCPQIRVEVVPLSKVPRSVQKGMVAATDCCKPTDVIGIDPTDDKEWDPVEAETSTKGMKRGYRKLQTEGTGDDSRPTAPPREPETDGASSYSSTDYSDYDQDEEESESEYDEALTCNVCDRSFNSTRLLAQHQQKKRHFGCSICDSVFPNLMALEHHKEVLDHWSEDEGNSQDSESEDDSEDEEVEKRSGELERLL